ncbi:hypothetical protein DFH08DRAFT_244139 [Mycena albidolilacea]|uniref:DUF7918 domain-containing protein n=1 Tax=Mycena albidolilacea TaxID=1033008 RepID=A0AAD6ZW47_9AGAR|nr:hypothetical protein DFH08DRAFT_244139 [Mycena albidolilacea]
MRLDELHAWISVDGVELPEFAVEYSADGKEASCWIPSECDKQFAVEFKNTRSSSWQTNAEITVDGIQCGSNNTYCRDHRHPQITSGSRNSVAISAHSRRPLLFAQQALTDDDNLLNAAISPELGSIKVQMRKVISVPSRRRQPVWPGDSFESKVLHERSKKAMGHSVQFGAAYPAINSQADPIEVIAELATFVFKYRPIELLRAQGIAPPEIRPAAAPIEVVDLTVDDDDASEIKQLEARLPVLKKKGVKVKSKSSGVKQEKSFVFAPGEIIDLT